MQGATDAPVRRLKPLDTPYYAYNKIHKRLVGPATAPKLVDLYESISEVQRAPEMYAAGWAAAEAALVGTHYSTQERCQLAIAARECWEYSLSLEEESAIQSGWVKGLSPDLSQVYRIASTLALAPIIEAIPKGIIPKSTLRSCQLQLLEVADVNNNRILNALDAHFGARVSVYRGVAYEQIATLGVNRMMSSRIVSLFSLARSGTGFHYPNQTHDIMVLNLDKGNIAKVTPTEAKATLSERSFDRYDAALFCGTAVLGGDTEMIGVALNAFSHELTGQLSEEERALLDSISQSMIHSMRHHHQAEKFGRHCLSLDECKLDLLAS